LKWTSKWIKAPPREAETCAEPLSISDEIEAWQMPRHKWGVGIPENANNLP